MEAHLDYMKSIDENPGIAPLAIGETLVGTQNKKMQFLGYSKFTPSWTYANSYQLVNNQSETFSSKVNTSGEMLAYHSLNHMVLILLYQQIQINLAV